MWYFFITTDFERYFEPKTSKGHFGPLRNILGLAGSVENTIGSSPSPLCWWKCYCGSVWLLFCIFQNPTVFHKYLSPLKLQRNGYVFICDWILVFRGDNSLKLCFFVLDISSKCPVDQFLLSAEPPFFLGLDTFDLETQTRMKLSEVCFPPVTKRRRTGRERSKTLT